MKVAIKSVIPAVLILSLAATGFAQRPPRNSFIEKRVYSVSDLINQTRNNPSVMDRYRRHFAMSSAEVIAYFNTLHASKLSKDGVYTVYGVPRTGELHTHLRLLKKGEPVFVDQDGVPALMMVCGNPLIFPKKPTMGNPVHGAVAEPAPSTEVAPAPPESSPSTPDISPSPPEAGPVPPGLPPPPRPHNNSVPMLLAFAGSIGFFMGHGGHHNCVPEPMTLIAMGAGIATVAARRRKKQTSA